METDGHVEKQSTVFPHVLAKRLGAFCTVPTGFTAVNPQTTKPDISLATKTGHFYLLPTAGMDSRDSTDSRNGHTEDPGFIRWEITLRHRIRSLRSIHPTAPHIEEGRLCPLRSGP